MIDRAIGIAGLALTIISPFIPRMSPRIRWGVCLIGLILLGVALGIALLPNGHAQSQPPTGNKTEGGNCNFPGGTNSGTINCGNTYNPYNQQPKVWRGWLEPANEQTPPNACDRMLPFVKSISHTDPITILFADSAAISTMPGNSIIFEIKKCPVLSMERGPNGIMIDASIAGVDGHPIGTIVKNGYNIPETGNIVVEHSGDLATLSVHDYAGHELLYTRYLNSQTMKVRGIFVCPIKALPLVVTITDQSIAPITGVHSMCSGDAHVAVDFE